MAQDVVVIIGAGGIGLAIARRQGVGRTVLLADVNPATLASAAEVLRGGSYAVVVQAIDVTSRASVRALAFTPADDLLALPFLQPDAVPDSMQGYMIAKRANALRVQATAITWGARGARVNAISPGIVLTPLAQHELDSPIGDGYRAMIAASPAGRMAPPEEIAGAAAFLLGPDAGFITGTDLLIDGGVIAAMRAGKLAVPD